MPSDIYRNISIPASKTTPSSTKGTSAFIASHPAAQWYPVIDLGGNIDKTSPIRQVRHLPLSTMMIMIIIMMVMMMVMSILTSASLLPAAFYSYIPHLLLAFLISLYPYCDHPYQPCKDVLVHIKEARNQHWDVMAISINYDVQGAVGDPKGAMGSSSLGALLALNLRFMRPKFVMVMIGHSSPLPTSVTPSPTSVSDNKGANGSEPTYLSAYGIQERESKYEKLRGAMGANKGAVGDSTEQSSWHWKDAGVGSRVDQAKRFLSRHGYTVHDDATESTIHSSNGSASGSEDGGVERCSDEQYTCVWGTLINAVEMYNSGS